MVVDKTVRNILRRLEIYYLKNQGFLLTGKSYDLILLISAESSYNSSKYSWIISAKFLDNRIEKEVINELLSDFNRILTYEEFSSVSRINVINSNHSIVNNLRFVFPYQEDVIELNELSIGGVRFDKSFIIHSKILEKLKSGNVVQIVTCQGEQIPAGIIAMDKNLIIKYYTAKGLRTLYKTETEDEKVKAKELEKLSEQEKIQEDLIALIKLKEIFTIA
jgi:hypothetical protein